MRMIPVHCIYAYQGILLPYLIMSFRIFLLRQYVALQSRRSHSKPRGRE